MADIQSSRDDLRTIKGIGPKRLQWLRKLNITSVRDLAVLSVDELESRLFANKRTVPRVLIESWIAEAQSRATEDASTDCDGWVSQAVFDVVFKEKRAEGVPSLQQTAVLFRDTGERKIWDSWQLSEIQEWIASHLPAMSVPDARLERHYDEFGETLPAADQDIQIPNTAQAIAVNEHQTRVDMRIVQVQIFQPTEQTAPCIGSSPEQLIARPIKAYEPFTVKARFETSGPNLDLRYNAHFFARDLGTGRKFSLGDTQSTHVDTLHYFTLTGASLQSGTYRIQISVTLDNTAEVFYLELPLLRVA
jgi:hypothetical protein